MKRKTGTLQPRKQQQFRTARHITGRRADFELLEARRLLTTIVVNSLSDAASLPNNLVDLRMAVATANGSNTATAITFDPSVFAGDPKILLSKTPLELSNTMEPITITGPADGVTINANRLFRVFTINNTVHATLSNLGVTGGNATTTDGAGFTAGEGGGILNEGTTTLRNLTVFGNSASTDGGGIVNNGSMTLTNVTVAGNSSTAWAGILTEDSMTMTNVTISGNTEAGANMESAGIGNLGGTLNIANSIIAKNSPKVSDVFGPVNSYGYNLIGNAGLSTGWNGTDVTGTANLPLYLKLAPLGDYGGIAPTILPLPGSPAINAGSNDLIPAGVTTDERGLPRIAGGRVDIGAVEVQRSLTLQLPSANEFILIRGLFAVAGARVSPPLGDFTQFGTTGPYHVDVKWGDGTADAKFVMKAAGMIPLMAHTFSAVGTDVLSVTVSDSAGHVSNALAYKVKVSPPQYALISGTVFETLDPDGGAVSEKLGLAGWEVYDDVNNVGKFVSGDPFAFTDLTGAYALSLPETGATAYLRQMTPANWTQTTPASNGAISVVLDANSIKTGLDFGDYTPVRYLRTVATISGLVGWWTFDAASGANSIINGYTGNLEGGAKISAMAGVPISGETNRSGLSLNGNGGYVNTNLTRQQEFTTTHTIYKGGHTYKTTSAAATFNVWVNFGGVAPPAGKIYTILAKSQFGNDLDLQLESDGKIHFYTDTGSSDSFTPPSLTGWHMLTAEFDTAAKTRKIFWDGELMASTIPYTGTHSASTQNFSIGESDLFTGRYDDGSLDEVSLWNRALTAEEIMVIYSAAHGG